MARVTSSAGPRAPRTVTAVLVGLVRCCHPGPTVVVTAAVTAYALGVGRDLAGSLLVLVAVLTGQLSVGWSNDGIDAARDRAVGRADKPTVTGLVAPLTLLRLAVGALVVSLAVSFVAAGARGGLCHALFLGCAWSYNLALKATPFSLLAYAVGFGALPGFVTFGLDPSRAPDWWATVAAGLLGVAAGLANAAPDVDDDHATGVHGAVGRLGASRARAACVAALVLATAVLAVGARGGDGGAATGRAAALVGVVAVLGAVALRYRGGALLFPAVLVIALLDVAVLVLAS